MNHRPMIRKGAAHCARPCPNVPPETDTQSSTRIISLSLFQYSYLVRCFMLLNVLFIHAKKTSIAVFFPPFAVPNLLCQGE